MAAEVCNQCGLPDELCVCEDMAVTESELSVTTEPTRRGEDFTVVKGFDGYDKSELKELSSDLKGHIGCGGTVDSSGSKIKLQGTSRIDDVVEYLENGEFTVTRELEQAAN